MFLLMALAVAASEVKPTITLVVWPVGQRVWGGQPLFSGAAVRIDDPERELACPEIRVDWGDGSASAVQTQFNDCDPFSLTTPIGYGFFPKLHAYRGPGQFLVVACVIGVKGECLKGLTATRLVSIRDPGASRRRWAWR